VYKLNRKDIILVFMQLTYYQYVIHVIK